GLVKVCQLVDIRHEPSKQDVQMYEYLKTYGLDGLVVATKSDKISRNEMQRNMARIRKTLGMRKEDILIPVSALKKTGHEELLAAMEEVLAAGEEAAAEEQSDS
ncbi:MAG: YihA family ribosome biogenesis GTP-binding protein, partial [Firmicutes bacterium]|nr:YihA family ribosome biogenesis GTP-binding protein [Bacillota bacterium]